MSSLRNAVKRKTHKERAQPADRRKYGLLEKHKDYVLRARDYHRKEDAIRALKEKASSRNPDEFYFSMERQRTEGGVHVTPHGTANKYTEEQLRVMKTQDIKYVLSRAQTDAKRAERMQAHLHSIGERRPNTHVVFADDSDDAERMRPALEERAAREPGAAPLPAAVKRRRAAAYRELAERRARAAAMQTMVQEMALKKELMGRGSVRKLKLKQRGGEEERIVYKWKRERKK